jgi:hypothetical protein
MFWIPGSWKAAVIWRVAAITAELPGSSSWSRSLANLIKGVTVTDRTATRINQAQITNHGRRNTTCASRPNTPSTGGLSARSSRGTPVGLRGQVKFTSSHR